MSSSTSSPALVARAGAAHLPLRDESVDLIVTSPPYYGQRAYEDGGEVYDGQIGGEPTPQEFLAAMYAVMHECWRVLKPEGVCFVNFGDKRVADNRGSAKRRKDRKYAPAGPAGFARGFGRDKSKMLLPHRFAIGCEDGLADPEGIGWVVRQDLVWDKPNGMPEAVRDRPRDGHEYWFMLTREPDYFSAIDELRQPYQGDRALSRRVKLDGDGAREQRVAWDAPHPLGSLPGSVWRIPTSPLVVPEHVGVDHYAAFPAEWVRRLVLGWSPSAICLHCGTGRRPDVERTQEPYRDATSTGRPKRQDIDGAHAANGWNGAGYPQTVTRAQIVGYRCRCLEPTAPTRPAVVLDPFGGTGTTAMVARALGRIGISLDLSADYSRLARWRVFESGHGAKVESATNADRQGVLL